MDGKKTLHNLKKNNVLSLETYYFVNRKILGTRRNYTPHKLRIYIL